MTARLRQAPSEIARDDEVDAKIAVAVGAEATARVAGDALAIPLAQKGANNGVATLGSDGKIPDAQIPPIALGDTFVVGTQAAMLALVAQRGDIAVRTDVPGTFILRGSNPALLADWQQLPFQGVLTVDGRTGVVTLSDLYDPLGAAAAAQAFAIQRSNHTGTQLASTISNFTTAVQNVGAFNWSLVAILAGAA